MYIVTGGESNKLVAMFAEYDDLDTWMYANLRTRELDGEPDESFKYNNQPVPLDALLRNAWPGAQYKITTNRNFSVKIMRA